MSGVVLVGEHPERGTLYAAVDQFAHHVEGRVAERKFGAFLAPFRSLEEAEAALTAEGARLGGPLKGPRRGQG